LRGGGSPQKSQTLFDGCHKNYSKGIKTAIKEAPEKIEGQLYGADCKLKIQFQFINL